MPRISTPDAVGRPIRVGDTIGHSTDDATAPFVGVVTQVEPDQVRAVPFPPPDTDPDPDPDPDSGQWLRARGVFHIGRSLEGQLRPFQYLAEAGPALFFVSSFADAPVTVTRIDQVAPGEPRATALCLELIDCAFTTPDRAKPTTLAASEGPAILYAASDWRRLWRVDQTIVQDPREWALCRGLLHHALSLLRNPDGAPPVFQVDGGTHSHWTWVCRKETGGCGYQTPFFSPTDDDAWRTYDSHRANCLAQSAREAR